jgi:uncharacterized membrane protein YdjX (TVP38/TMEM64 family)
MNRRKNKGASHFVRMSNHQENGVSSALEHKQWQLESGRLRFISFIIVAAFISVTIYLFFYSASTLRRSEYASRIGVPTNFDEMRELAHTLRLLRHHLFFPVVMFFCSLYILKQTFSLPGSALLNVLAGHLFGLFVGFPLACSLTTLGACCCFLISNAIGRGIVRRLFPKKLATLSNVVERNRSDLFYYLIFMRLVPFTPNWFLNLAAPHVNIPLAVFAPSVFIGLMPYNFLCVQAGGLLSELNSMNDIFDGWTFAKLIVLAFVALIPVVIKHKLKIQ